MNRFVIDNVIIVNEGRQSVGSVTIEDNVIVHVEETVSPSTTSPSLPYLLPGVIDEHVHFREPGLVHKADIVSESRAAAAGGVTSFFDMPNCIPQTTTLEEWESKMEHAARHSVINFAFHFGATNTNNSLFPRLDTKHIPAIKLFMGSSTGNMLVEREEALRRIFAESPIPIMAHCEDTALIAHNTALARERWGDDPELAAHAFIRSREACLSSSRKAVCLAEEYGARLMIAHVSTEEELELFHRQNIVSEACVPHLLFTEDDLPSLGTRIKCNPAIKADKDRAALRRALKDGRIRTIATDHAPHLLSEKQGGALGAASGMPMVQFSLIAMLGLVDEGVLSMEQLVALMCHHPAQFFGVERRGFIRPGYKADLVLVRRTEPWTLQRADILSKCGWSPLEGRTFQWRVERTYCNGKLVFDGKKVLPEVGGEAIRFAH